MAIDLKKTDVVIVGLGAVGGVAALPLARAGGAKPLSIGTTQRTPRSCGWLWARLVRRCVWQVPARRFDSGGSGRAKAIINVTAMRVVVGHCPRDQVPDFPDDYPS
jgi:glycine/D-amino acid oxidase-like deaminating enzyme